MEMYEKPHKLADYLDTHFSCDCKKEHYASLKFVSIGKNAMEQIPSFMKSEGFGYAYLICDSLTYKLAGSQCEKILSDAKIKTKTHLLEHLGFDEATLGEMLINFPLDCDVVIAVGTGSINDITRYFSFKTGRPFFTVATAAPMDGFASSISPINVNHLKTTFSAQTPIAIIGDTEILKNAPYSMIAAGLGDLVGKFTCLCDWRLAHIITGEHCCDKTIALVESCVQNVLSTADEARNRNPEVLGGIMEGLVLSGVAMSLYGTSRPASGCEHHMSHFWETVFEQRKLRPAPHGIQVGVGTVLILKAVEALLSQSVDFDFARKAALAYNPQQWQENINRVYGSAASGIISLEKQANKNETSSRLQRIDSMEKNWDKITELLKALPSSQRIIELLQSLDAPFLPDQIDIDRETLKNTFLYCKEIRDRYTILQLLWDLNLLDKISDMVIGSL